MIVKIGNREINIVSASVLRTMDTGADEFRVITDWVPGKDQEFDELIKPRSFADAKVSIGGQKLIAGTKYITSPRLDKRGQMVELTCYSKTMRLIKSNPKSAQEFNNLSLLDISRKFTYPFGLFTKILGSVESQVNEPFESEKIGPQEFIFDFLQNLARQRGVLTSSDEDGNLYYLEAKTNQETIGSIIEGPFVPDAESFSATFDDTEIFRTYQAVNNNPFAFLVKSPQGIAEDTRVPIPGFKTILTDSLAKGAGQKAVDFAKNQTIARSMSIPFQVNSWYSSKGELYRENRLVSVSSPTLFTDGFTFLIRAVQFNLDANGETATLFLVPPSLYTGDEVKEPW
jgi:prophage tail gpP-like protein